MTIFTRENKTKLPKAVALVAHSHIVFLFAPFFLVVKAWASFYIQKKHTHTHTKNQIRFSHCVALLQ